jgi:hypothetical protein
MSDGNVRIIRMENHLRGKLDADVNLTHLFPRDRIEECQALIEREQKALILEVETQFEDVMATYQYATLHPAEREVCLDDIDRAMMLIYSRLDALGYYLGSKLANSLYNYGRSHPYQRNIVVYCKHIELLHFVIRTRLSMGGGEYGREIMLEIERLIAKYDVKH